MLCLLNHILYHQLCFDLYYVDTAYSLNISACTIINWLNSSKTYQNIQPQKTQYFDMD